MKRYVRKRFLFALFLFLVCAVAGHVTVRRMIDPEATRLQAEMKLSALLDADVHIARAAFDPILGLRLVDMTISLDDDNGVSTLLARVAETRLSHHFMSVFGDEITYRHITIEGAEVYLERYADGHSNIERFLRMLGRDVVSGARFPEVRIERTRFHYTDHVLTDASGKPMTGEVDRVTAVLTPLDSSGGRFRANASGSDPDFGVWTIRDATFDASAGTLGLSATSSVIAVGPSLRDRINGRGRQVWESYNPVGGSIRFEVRMDYASGRTESPLDFEVLAHLDGVSLAYESFPYRVNNVTGTVRFSPEGIALEHLKSVDGDAVSVYDGTVRGYEGDVPFTLRAEGTGIPFDRNLYEAFDEPQRAVWDSLKPVGKADLVVRFERKALGGAMRTRVLATHSKGSRVATRYDAFPYALDLEGWVFYDDGQIRIIEKPWRTETMDSFRPGILRAYHGETVIEASGAIDLADASGPSRLMDLSLRVAEGSVLKFDDALKDAVPKGMQVLWDYLALSGTARGTCQITRDDVREERADLVLELTDLRLMICCQDFPYVIENPSGSVVYERRRRHSPNGRLLVRNLKSSVGDATVAIDGEINGLADGAPVESMDLNIRAANLPLDDKLRRAIPADYRRVWEYLSPAPGGRVNVQCKLERTRPDQERADFSLDVDSLGASLSCADFPYRVEGLKGRIEYRRNGELPTGRLRLVDLHREGDGVKVNVSGTLDGFEEGRPVERVRLDIEAKDVPLDATLRAALSEEHRRVYDSFHLEGLVDVSCVLKRPDRETPMATDIAIAPLGASARYDKFPLKVTDLAGRVRLSGDEVRLSKVRGRAAGGILELDGLVHGTAAGPGIDLAVAGKDLVLGDELRDSFPESYRAAWRQLDLKGVADVSGTVTERTDGPDKGALAYRGVLQPRNASCRTGFELKDMTGSVWVDGVLADAGHRFEGRCDLATLTVRGHSLQKVAGTFEKRNGELRIHKLTGQMYGGELTAQCRVGLEDPVDYSIIADASDVHLGELLRAAFDVKSDRLHGRLSGRFSVQGQGNDVSTLVGRADLRVREGRLWDIPPILALLKVLNLSYPESTAFTDARVVFDLYDKRIKVNRLDLVGSAISIYGKGTVASNGAVKFDFETGWGRVRLPSLPLVSDVVRGIQQQVISVKMTGTLREPELKITPIAPLTMPMRGIMGTVAATREP